MSEPPTRAGLRAEPYRLLFPLAGLCGLVGVAPWLLFGLGWSRAWPGLPHATTMMQAFVFSAVAGFVGTMIPRRTGTPPIGAFGLAVCAATPIVVTIGGLIGAYLAARIAALMGLATLGALVTARLQEAWRDPKRPQLASFGLIPVAFAVALLGGMVRELAPILSRGVGTRGSAWESLAALGVLFEREGFIELLVVALSPMLAGAVAHEQQIPPGSPAERRRRSGWFLAAGLALVASFALQIFASPRAGLLTRGLVIGAVFALAARLDRWPSLPGLHRRMFWLAAWSVPLGLVCAGARPAWRLSFEHVTFIAGLSLLVFGVSQHVVAHHTGRPEAARRSPLLLWVCAGLTLGSALVRAAGEAQPGRYFGVLAWASGLWLLGALSWLAVQLAMILRDAGSSR